MDIYEKILQSVAWMKQMPAYPGDLQKVRVHSLFHSSHSGLFAEVVRAQQAEVVVRVAVVQRQDQVDQRLPAAQQKSLSCMLNSARSPCSPVKKLSPGKSEAKCHRLLRHDQHNDLVGLQPREPFEFEL